MPKIMLHNSEARRALARGVFRLAAAVEPTLGPKGMNAMIDRPIGTPMVTRDGVSIASEIELHDRFENMGAQVVREVSMQTNEVAGDGTTTAIVLANALIQGGVEANERGVKSVDLCKGIDLAVAAVVAALKASAKPAKANGILASVANIAATNAKLGALGKTTSGKKLKIRSYPKFESLEEERLYRKQHLAAAFRIFAVCTFVHRLKKN